MPKGAHIGPTIILARCFVQTEAAVWTTAVLKSMICVRQYEKHQVILYLELQVIFTSVVILWLWMCEVFSGTETIERISQQSMTKTRIVYTFPECIVHSWEQQGLESGYTDAGFVIAVLFGGVWNRLHRNVIRHSVISSILVISFHDENCNMHFGAKLRGIIWI